jgi:hypothetical protein
MEHFPFELVALHTADLRRDAARRHLVRLATCCHPSAWRQAARRMRTALHRSPACATC